MRIRVGSNLKAFPMLGTMTKTGRINFERTMLVAFASLMADPHYGGTVLSMTPDEA